MDWKALSEIKHFADLKDLAFYSAGFTASAIFTAIDAVAIASGYTLFTSDSSTEPSGVDNLGKEGM